MSMTYFYNFYNKMANNLKSNIGNKLKKFCFILFVRKQGFLIQFFSASDVLYFFNELYHTNIIIIDIFLLFFLIWLVNLIIIDYFIRVHFIAGSGK